jgi:glycine/D-amino acid oxidase-like deaminating enzyme/nitrite reductase/ring-hydroxylating ferredoxin subunit
MTQPPWPPPDVIASGPLDADRSVDVCVVGAGIAGLTTAHLLARAGREVLVLEAGAVAEGESLRTTAHLVTALDRGWTSLVAVHGDAHARAAAASHAAAIDHVERFVAEEEIGCAFRRVDGLLFGDDRKALEQELRAAHAAGLAGVEMVTRAPLPGVPPGPCLRFPAQARLDPTPYLRGLAAAATRAGASLVERTPVTEVADHGALEVHTATGRVVTAASVVVATNTPITTRVAFHVKQAPYRTYVVALEVPDGAVEDALYWDTDEPFHYVRLATGSRGELLLLAGGEDHKTGQDADGPEVRFGRLEAWARARVPGAGAVAARWSGQVMESMDGLAFIGPVHAGSRVFVATGDSGNGYTHGTLAGMILADAIAGRANPWADTYDPGRMRVRALGTLAGENLNVARQMTDWFGTGEARSVDEVAPGSGAIVRRGVVPVAAYRDPQGRLHERSAVCPHLGCIVHWNRTEGSWDCPCHGSRFDATGRVLNGPAARDLAALDDDRAPAAERAPL